MASYMYKGEGGRERYIYWNSIKGLAIWVNIIYVVSAKGEGISYLARLSDNTSPENLS